MLDKLEKKDHLIIFVLCLIVISLGALLVVRNPADIRVAKNNNVSLDKNININLNKNTNQIINQNINQNQNTNINQPVATTSVKIDTSDWQTYRNEEYSFEVKYPSKWYWEDYTEGFKHPMIGFYPDGKEKGWEYVGSIEIHKFKKNKEDDILTYFKNIYRDLPYIHDKVIKIKNKNNKEVILIYNVPGNINFDVAFVDCNDYVILIKTPFGVKKDIMQQMADDILCW